ITTMTFGRLIEAPGLWNFWTACEVLPPVDVAMLPHATQPGRPIELCNTEQQAFTLVFENLSGRISVSLNRTAIPAGRDAEGAVKRGLPGFCVFFFFSRFLL